MFWHQLGMTVDMVISDSLLQVCKEETGIISELVSGNNPESTVFKYIMH